ncbi:MAG: ribonuclease H-like domain-containing protein [Deltaproteobacteria bacterium]|nr:MAG: ribonuclease H-like domain-containing protein [Deltaproteobacteria bacterium]
MPANQIVLDLETKKTFQEVGGRGAAELGVTVIGTYFYEGNRYVIYEENQIAELEQQISLVTRVIGFNIRRFDFVVLQPYMKHIKLADIAIFDIMDDLERLLGHRVSLQSVASATLNVGKSGSGLDAIEYYRTGQMEKLKKYCLDDVRLTMEVYEFGKQNGRVFYWSKDGSTKKEVAVEWKDPEPPTNFSLF